MLKIVNLPKNCYSIKYYCCDEKGVESDGFIREEFKDYNVESKNYTWNSNLIFPIVCIILGFLGICFSFYNLSR